MPKSKSFSLILLGTFIWSLTMVKSGLPYSYGIGFWGPNGHDGIWHLSLITSLSGGSLGMPIFAGETIKNYHIGFDLLVSILHLVTFIPVSFLYFQILPPLLALGIGLAVYRFVMAWQKNESAAFWGVFFVYFGGSFGWLVSFLRNRNFGGESMFWSQQSISSLLNPPFALSLLMIFTGLTYLVYYLEKPNPKNFLLSLILFGLLAEIKIYAGLIVVGGLFILSVVDFIKRRRLGIFKLSVGTALLSLLIFLPLNHGSQNLVVFRPGWFLQTMLIYSDRFYWPRLYQAIVDSRPIHNWLKFSAAYLLALIIFLVGNLGTRLLSVYFLFQKKKMDYLAVLITSMSFIGLLFSLLIIQKGTPWNPIQFFYYTQMFLGLLAGVSFSSILKKYPRLLIVNCTLLILLTVPTTVDALNHYLPNRPPAMISTEEAKALKFLEKSPQGTVLTYPVKPDPYYPAPRPLYYYDSTAYVSAYSGHPAFLEDTVNLNITGYAWPEREAAQIQFLSETDAQIAKNFIVKNRIKYIYLPLVSKFRPFLSASQMGGRILYENSQAAIWQVGTD